MSPRVAHAAVALSLSASGALVLAPGACANVVSEWDPGFPGQPATLTVVSDDEGDEIAIGCADLTPDFRSVTVNGEFLGGYGFPGCDQVEAIEVSGNDGQDVIDLSGVALRDYTSAGIGGNIRVNGGEGSDEIDGSQLDDRLGATEGVDDGSQDVIRGGFGNDVIAGGGSGDLIEAGPGDDAVSGGDASDVVRAGAGDDTVGGGQGPDELEGGGGADSLGGGRGPDELAGGGGADRLVGGGAADLLKGAGGRDTLLGGRGHDHLIGGPELDRLFGGPGRDLEVQ